MDYRKFENQYVIRLDRGEEIVASLKTIAEKENIKTCVSNGNRRCGQSHGRCF